MVDVYKVIRKEKLVMKKRLRRKAESSIGTLVVLRGCACATFCDCVKYPSFPKTTANITYFMTGLNVGM